MKPGRGLFIAALAWLGLGAGAFFSDTLFLAWTISAICLLPVLVLDAVLLFFFCCRFKVERELPLTLAQGEPVKVRLRLQRAGTRADAGRTTGVLFPAAAEIFDLYPSLMDNTADVPAQLRTQAPGFPVRLPRKELKAGDLDFVYTLIPRERGPWFFPGVEFLYTSPLCFWRLKVFCACRSAGRTYPDFKKLMAGSALRGLLEEQGIREIRRRGQGLEFRDLREYQEGDPIKSIDWRATGRLRSPAGGWRFIVREYQEEQDQQVLCILDTGYRLRGNEFDAALHGTMLLAYTALKHGDAAAVMSFGSTERWVPPRKGLRSFNVIMNRLYDLQSSSAPSSPFFALENALARLHRRTFMILISNFREEDGASLSWILPRIRRKHLLLLVSFRDAEAERLARVEKTALPPETAAPSSEQAVLPADKAAISDEKAWERAAAFSYVVSRRRLYQSWEHQGLLTMEGAAENFSSALVNRYLEVKRSGKL